MDATFGRRIREERERRRWPQQHLATSLSALYGHAWHQTTVAKVEAGERPVKLAEAVALAALLHMPLGDLLDDDAAPAERPNVDLAVAELARLESQIARRRDELQTEG